MKSNEIQDALEQGSLFDSAIVRHGFTIYLRTMTSSRTPREARNTFTGFLIAR